MRALKRHAKARWHWLFIVVAVIANVYGFVGFPDPTESEVPEAQAHSCPPMDRGCNSAHPPPADHHDAADLDTVVLSDVGHLPELL